MPQAAFAKKYTPFIIIALILVVVVVIAIVSGKEAKKPATAKLAASSPCGVYRNDHAVIISGQAFEAEIPNSPAAYEKGLGGRPCILPNQAMLFIFKKPGQYPFWMKGMKFPIDIIWIGADHKVAAVEINEQPSTYPDKFVNQNPAQYVVELKANTASNLHINIGTPVSL